MVEILRSKDQTGPLWWRFSSAIVALYSLSVTQLGISYVYNYIMIIVVNFRTKQFAILVDILTLHLGFSYFVFKIRLIRLRPYF